MPQNSELGLGSEHLLSVSIIIPFQRWNAYLDETIEHLTRQDYAAFDLVLLPDSDLESEKLDWLKRLPFACEVIPTGPVSPAIKRDRGAEKSSADILAFIDDDAFPKEDWLKKALEPFNSFEVCAVGGPQVTPDRDTFWQKVSGATFLSILNGALVDRYWPNPSARNEVDDWPSVNLLVRRKDFLFVGGFDSAFWPGEDTKLCRDLVVKLSKKIAYAPFAIVYHHRRAGFRRHMKQIGNYALHRGFFAKRFPETSRRLCYFIPSLFLVYTLAGSFLFLFELEWLERFYLLGWMVYLIALIVSTWSIYSKLKNLPLAAATVPYIVGTHLWYGARFIVGILLVKDLHSKLGR